jgi:hypothetical protein
MRVVYYCLVDRNDERYELQWVRSIRSLRRFNPHIEVHLVLFDAVPPRLIEEAARLEVTTHDLGNFGEYLRRLHVHGASLRRFTPLSKLVSLHEVLTPQVSQALYIDCDTYFFNDVERLFEEYQEHGCYGREEPTSRLSYLGYDSQYIDEDRLREIAETEGAQFIAPINTGILLFNQGVLARLERLRVTHVDTQWRLALGWWLALPEGCQDEPPEEEVMEMLTEFDRSRALAYPSGRIWIIDQIAIWLTLGRALDGPAGVFRREHVAQNGEFDEALAAPGPLVVTHYFSVNEEAFLIAMQAAGYALPV